MSKRKKQQSRRGRSTGRSAVRDALLQSPARTLLELEATGAPEGAKRVIAQRLYQIEDGPNINLALVAAETNASVLDAARSCVTMEDANMMLWQPGENRYWLLVSDPNADSS
jgi:hypothetical protein